MLIYCYDNNFIYTRTQDAQLDLLESQIQGQNVYILPGNATFIAPISYDQTLEYLQFDPVNQAWIKKDIQIDGNYYLKADGSLHIGIAKKDLNLYTQIPITLTSGDVVHFDDTTSAWVCDTEGAATLAVNLAVKKQTTIAHLNSTYASVFEVAMLHDSKTISWFVNSQYILTLDQEKSQASSVPYTILKNIQDKNGDIYSLSVTHIFLDWLFFSLKPVHDNNKRILNQYSFNIERASSLAAVDTIKAAFDLNVANAQVYPERFFDYNVTQLKALCNQVDFIKNITIDIDYMADTIAAYSDAELIAFGANSYTVQHFREWYSALTKDANGRYNILRPY